MRANDGLQLRRAISIQAEGMMLLEKHTVAPSAARLCSASRRTKPLCLFHSVRPCVPDGVCDKGSIASAEIVPRTSIPHTRIAAPSPETRTSNRNPRISMAHRNTLGMADGRRISDDRISPNGAARFQAVSTGPLQLAFRSFFNISLPSNSTRA